MDSKRFQEFSSEARAQYQPHLGVLEVFSFINRSGKKFIHPRAEIDEFIRAWDQHRSAAESALSAGREGDIYQYNETAFRSASAAVLEAAGASRPLATIRGLTGSQTAGFFEITDLYVRATINSAPSSNTIALDATSIETYLARVRRRPLALEDLVSFGSEDRAQYQPHLGVLEVFSFINRSGKKFIHPRAEIDEFIRAWDQHRSAAESALSAGREGDIYQYNETAFRSASAAVLEAAGASRPLATIRGLTGSQTAGFFEITDLYVRATINSAPSSNTIALDATSIETHLRSPLRGPRRGADRLPPTNAWLLIALGADRQYAGNDGYDDSVDAYYSWDSTVQNHANVRVGDNVALWDGSLLLGVATIESISSEFGTKSRRRCPVCTKTGFKKSGEGFYCPNCKNHFLNPTAEEIEVTKYRASYASTWTDLSGALMGNELRSACVSPNSIHSMRPMDWGALSTMLRDRVPDRIVRRIARAELNEVAGGHREVMVRARMGQSDFRADLLQRFGPVCALSGEAPTVVLEAAHLYSYAKVGKHHEDGGLLLRRDVHRLFDRGDLAIHPDDLRVDADPQLNLFSAYSALHGSALKVEVDAGHRRWLEQHWLQHRGD